MIMKKDLYVGCLVLQLMFVISMKLKMTRHAAKKAPFYHLLLYLIKVIISGGASVIALQSGI